MGNSNDVPSPRKLFKTAAIVATEQYAYKIIAVGGNVR
jgi:hypothetical protein